MQSPTGSSGEVEEVDLSGLMESVVDSDEDEEEEECDETSLLVRDAVRECLEKDPSDRGNVNFFKAKMQVQIEVCTLKTLSTNNGFNPNLRWCVI